MKQRWVPLLLAAVLLLLTVAGCSSTPQYRHFDLAITGEAPPSGETALDIVVRVERAEVGALYDDQRLVYRVSPHEVAYDGLNRWAVAPGKLVADQVASSLRAHPAIGTVTTHGSPPPDYRLNLVLVTLEEDRTQNLARVHLQLSLRRADGEVVWKAEARGSRALDDNTPDEVVRALSMALSEAWTEAAPGLVDALHKDAQKAASSDASTME